MSEAIVNYEQFKADQQHAWNGFLAALEKIKELERRAERDEADHCKTIEQRDRAEDCIQETHVALGGDGEWAGKIPTPPPPDSGDLILDLPALACQVADELCALRQRVGELEKQAALYIAVERAAADLPEHYVLSICIEQGSGYVELNDGRGEYVNVASNNESLAELVSDAIDAAISAQAKE